MKRLAFLLLVLATLACGGTAAPTAPLRVIPTAVQDCNSDAVFGWLNTQTSLLQESDAGWGRFTGDSANALVLAREAESRYRQSIAVFAPECMKPVAQNQTDSFYEEWQYFLAISRGDDVAAAAHSRRMDELFNDADFRFGGAWFEEQVIPRLDP